MDKNEILTRVKGVVSAVLKTESSEITDDANFVFDLGADSMQSVELVAGFEEEFDIEMDQDRALEVQSRMHVRTRTSFYTYGNLISSSPEEPGDPFSSKIGRYCRYQQS